MAVDPQVLRKLQRLENPVQLKGALSDLCRPFGQVVRLEVFPVGENGFVCLVDLGSTGQNAALRRELGGFSFGGSVGFRIPASRDEN